MIHTGLQNNAEKTRLLQIINYAFSCFYKNIYISLFNIQIQQWFLKLPQPNLVLLKFTIFHFATRTLNLLVD